MNRSYPALAARILLLLSVSPVVAQTPDTPAICLPGPDFFKGLFFGVILGFTVAGLSAGPFRRQLQLPILLKTRSLFLIPCRKQQPTRTLMPQLTQTVKQ